MFDPVEILRVLAKHDVDFILVGGFSAIVQGADIHTGDVDVVHSRDPGNWVRLLKALRELDAWYRLRTDKKLYPNESHLVTTGHQLLTTTHGNLDVRGKIGDDLTYDSLTRDAQPEEIAPGLLVKTLSLEKYVQLKEQLSRDKDKAVLPTLRATLQEKRKLERRKTPNDPTN
jgi:predicted nucleotidyltransferase